MKRYISLIFVILFCASLIGCSAINLPLQNPVENSNSPTISLTTEPIIEETPSPSNSPEIIETVIPENSETNAEPSILPSQTTTSISDTNKNLSNNTTNNTEDTAVTELSTNSSFSIHYIDVGQADAALVECDGHYMLIDGGNKGDSSKIYSILKKAGVNNLDIVVGTHPHEDHIGGIPGAFNYATADLTLSPVTSYDSDAFDDFKKYADKNGNGLTIPSIGDTYNLGNATVEILGLNAGSDTNDNSIVLKINYGNTSFLFTGDAERDSEQVILNSGADLSSTVLKVGHHGSDSSTTYPFLREIMPLYAIIGVGAGNSYGHPTDNTLSRLRDADVQIYRTDLNGDIYAVSDGETVTITTDKNASEEDILKAGSGNSSNNVTATTTEPTKAPEENKQSVGDYIANTNTGKFHLPSCSSVKKMKDKNKKAISGTREDVIAQGYVPCKNCNP